MRDEREKRDWREMSRTSYTCANPAYLASPTQLARHTFLASPARRACRAPCGHSSALSLTDPNRAPTQNVDHARKCHALFGQAEPQYLFPWHSRLYQPFFTSCRMLEIGNQHPIKMPVSDPVR
jgi:hypothetical protein